MDEYEKQDEEIASLVQSGQVELFGILIDRYEKKMHRYASRLLSNRDDVYDVVQQVFIKAYINIQSFQTNRKFSSWLYRIAHNEIINVFKKNKRKSFLPLFDLDVFLPHATKSNEINENIERQEMKEVIEKCFSQLEEKYKEPIVLYYLEELSYKEIADIMHIPIATVGVRIKRAKDILKTIFTQHGYTR